MKFFFPTFPRIVGNDMRSLFHYIQFMAVILVLTEIRGQVGHPFQQQEHSTSLGCILDFLESVSF